ncbi:hypothetical protein [Kitasatospora sp. NBC_00315]|uniref:hypothetical protein n=1 Tax=Kitasatospora sp. NBC_00315 TaxID=2975963 RepID=UPI00324E87C0
MFGDRAAKKHPRRSLVAGSAAFVGAAVITVGLGLQPAAANGDTRSPSHSAATRTADPAEPGLGSSNLIQSDDFFQQGLSAVGATVELAGTQGLSACSGEETMRSLTDGKAAAYADVAWTFDTNGSLLNESVADLSGDGSAVSYEKQLNDLVRSCQHEPAGHWHYGPGQALTLAGGEGHWYPSVNGDGAVSGGVAVVRSGRRIGIVELVGAPSNDPGYMKGITAVAINRLAS